MNGNGLNERQWVKWTNVSFTSIDITFNG